MEKDSSATTSSTSLSKTTAQREQLANERKAREEVSDEDIIFVWEAKPPIPMKTKKKIRGKKKKKLPANGSDSENEDDAAPSPRPSHSKPRIISHNDDYDLYASQSDLPAPAAVASPLHLSLRPQQPPITATAESKEFDATDHGTISDCSTSHAQVTDAFLAYALEKCDEPTRDEELGSAMNAKRKMTECEKENKKRAKKDNDAKDDDDDNDLETPRRIWGVTLAFRDEMPDSASPRPSQLYTIPNQSYVTPTAQNRHSHESKGTSAPVPMPMRTHVSSVGSTYRELMTSSLATGQLEAVSQASNRADEELIADDHTTASHAATVNGLMEAMPFDLRPSPASSPLSDLGPSNNCDAVRGIETFRDLTSLLINSARIMASASLSSSSGSDSEWEEKEGSEGVEAQKKKLPRRKKRDEQPKPPRRSTGFDLLYKSENSVMNTTAPLLMLQSTAKAVEESEKDDEADTVADAADAQIRQNMHGVSLQPVSPEPFSVAESSSAVVVAPADVEPTSSTSIVSEAVESVQTTVLSLSQPSISRHFTPFQSFRRFQKLADAQSNCNAEEGQRVFSCEYADGKQKSQGTRYFIVCRLDEFWHEYSVMPANRRFFYEIIPGDIPCRLHFDLEFDRTIEHNKTLDHELVYANFVTATLFCLRELGLSANPDKDFLALDSSTDAKFSCHVVVDIEGLLFPSNLSMKGLVDRIQRLILAFAPFKIYDSNGQQTTIVDKAIYRNNSNFRLFGSTKQNKNAPLKLATYCKKYAERSSPPTDEQLFLDSLVVPPLCVSASCRFVDMSPFSQGLERQQHHQQVQQQVHASAMLLPAIAQPSIHFSVNSSHRQVAQLLATRMKAEPIGEEGEVMKKAGNLPGTSSALHTIGRLERSISLPNTTRFTSSSFIDPSLKQAIQNAQASGRMFNGRLYSAKLYAPSPHPRLDEAVTQMLKHFNPRATVYRYALIYNQYDLENFESIEYSPGDCRYCHNIGRGHQQNGTFWVLNFREGRIWQDCFDEKCRQSRKIFYFRMPRFFFYLVGMQPPRGYRWMGLIAEKYYLDEIADPTDDDGKTPEEMVAEIAAERKEFWVAWRIHVREAMHRALTAR